MCEHFSRNYDEAQSVFSERGEHVEPRRFVGFCRKFNHLIYSNIENSRPCNECNENTNKGSTRDYYPISDGDSGTVATTTVSASVATLQRRIIAELRTPPNSTVHPQSSTYEMLRRHYTEQHNAMAARQREAEAHRMADVRSVVESPEPPRHLTTRRYRPANIPVPLSAEASRVSPSDTLEVTYEDVEVVETPIGLMSRQVYEQEMERLFTR